MLNAALLEWERRTFGGRVPSSVGSTMTRLRALASMLNNARVELGDPLAPQNQTPQARERMSRLDVAVTLFGEIYEGLTGEQAQWTYVFDDAPEAPIHTGHVNDRRVPRHIDFPAVDMHFSAAEWTQRALDVIVATEPFSRAQHLDDSDGGHRVLDLLDLASPPGSIGSPAHKLFTDIDRQIADTTTALVSAQRETAYVRTGAWLGRQPGFAAFDTTPEADDSAASSFDAHDDMQGLGKWYVTRVAGLAQMYDRAAVSYSPESLFRDVRDGGGSTADSDDDRLFDMELDVRVLREKWPVINDDLTTELAGAADMLYQAGRMWLHEWHRVGSIAREQQRDVAEHGDEQLGVYRDALIDRLRLLVRMYAGEDGILDETLLPGGTPGVRRSANRPDPIIEVFDAVRADLDVMETDNPHTLVSSVCGLLTRLQEGANDFRRSARAKMADEHSRTPVLINGEIQLLGEVPLSIEVTSDDVDAYLSQMDRISECLSDAIADVEQHLRSSLAVKFGMALVTAGVVEELVVEDAQEIIDVIHADVDADVPELATAVVARALTTTLGSGKDYEGRLLEFASRGVRSPLEVLVRQWREENPHRHGFEWVSRSWDALRLAIAEVDTLRESLGELNGPADPETTMLLAQCSAELRDVIRVNFLQVPSVVLEWMIDEIVPDVNAAGVETPPFEPMVDGPIGNPTLSRAPSQPIALDELPGHAMSVRDAVMQALRRAELPGNAPRALRCVREAAMKAAEMSEHRMEVFVARQLGIRPSGGRQIAVREMIRALEDDQRGHRPDNPKRAVLLGVWSEHKLRRPARLSDFMERPVVKYALTLPGEPRQISPHLLGVVPAVHDTRRFVRPMIRFGVPKDRMGWATLAARRYPSVVGCEKPLSRLDNAAHWLALEAKRLEEALNVDPQDRRAQMGQRDVGDLNVKCKETLELLLNRDINFPATFSPPLKTADGLHEYLRHWDRPFAEHAHRAREEMEAVVTASGQSDEIPVTPFMEQHFGGSIHTTTLEWVRFEVAAARRLIAELRRSEVATWLGEAVVHDRAFDMNASARDVDEHVKAIGYTLYMTMVGGSPPDEALAKTVDAWQLTNTAPNEFPVRRLMENLRSTPPPFPGPDLNGPGDPASGPSRTGPSSPANDDEALQAPAVKETALDFVGSEQEESSAQRSRPSYDTNSDESLEVVEDVALMADSIEYESELGDLGPHGESDIEFRAEVQEYARATERQRRGMPPPRL